MTDDIDALEAMVEAISRALRAGNAAAIDGHPLLMDFLPDPYERGYSGARCGWYPAKPKRRGRRKP